MSNGELPEGWSQVALKDVADYSAGRTPSRAVSQYWGGADGVPWVSIADMEPFGAVVATRESVSARATSAVFRKPPIPRGTLLMSFKLTIGRTSVLDLDAYHNEAIISINPREAVDRDYLRYYLPTVDYSALQDRAIKGQTLNRDKLDRLPVILPPLLEQRAIAGVLSKLQRAVEAQDKIIATLKELKAATLAKLFREGLRGEPLKETEIGEIPESWEVVELGDLCRAPDGGVQTGPFGSQLHASDYQISGVPIINPTHMREGRVIAEGIPLVSLEDAQRLKRHALREGDILFSRRGDVGLHARISTNEVGWLCGTGCLIVRAQKRQVESEFLSYYLDTTAAQDYLRGHAVGSIMPNINTAILSSVPVPMANMEEQEDIARSIEAVTSALFEHHALWSQLASAFQGMLHLLMTGEVRLAITE